MGMIIICSKWLSGELGDVKKKSLLNSNNYIVSKWNMSLKHVMTFFWLTAPFYQHLPWHKAALHTLFILFVCLWEVSTPHDSVACRTTFRINNLFSLFSEWLISLLCRGGGILFITTLLLSIEVHRHLSTVLFSYETVHDQLCEYKKSPSPISPPLGHHAWLLSLCR